MRTLIFLLLFMAAAPIGAAGLDWLAGHWCNADSEELWLPERAGLLLGINRSRSGKPAFENLRIVISDGKAAYHAQPGGRPATVFAEIARDAQSIVFSNPQHAYPRRIRYWREGPVLQAHIDDGEGGNPRDFRWEPCAD